MNKKIILIISIALLIVFIYARFMVSFIYTLPDENGFCVLKYDTEERGSEEFFGKYCAIVDYENYSIQKMYYNREEFKDFCVKPRFLEIGKWGSQCEKAANQEEQNELLVWSNSTPKEIMRYISNDDFTIFKFDKRYCEKVSCICTEIVEGECMTFCYRCSYEEGK